MTPQQRMLTEWHNDTFVAGPSWSEFAKAMGLDGDAVKIGRFSLRCLGLSRCTGSS